MLGPAKRHRLDEPIAVSLEELVSADHFYRHLEPKLDLSFHYEDMFYIFGPLGVKVTGDLGVAADLKFGFDTRGLRQFASGGFDDPLLILNGLYVSDTENADGTGRDVPEVQLFAAVGAYAALNP